jgi:hypothetical protein
MTILTYVNNDLGFRGRVVVAMYNGEGKEVDREMVFKHPFLLRIRCRLALRRLLVRQRKIAKFNAKHGGKLA